MSTADPPAGLLVGPPRPMRGGRAALGAVDRTVLRVAIPLVGVPIVLAALTTGGQGLAWERLHLTLAAAIGLVVGTISHRRATGRTRAVRGWIALAFVPWFGAELVRDLELFGLVSAVPPDLGLLLVGACALGAYRATVHGRLSPSAELSVYLDAAIVCVAVAASLLAVIGIGSVEAPQQLSLLLHTLLFLGLFASTALIDLAVLTPRTASGSYAILGGLALIGIGFIGQREVVDLLGTWPFASLVSTGVVLAAYGTATWTEEEDRDPAYVRLAQRARDLIPLAAVAAVPLILLPAQVAIEDLASRALINAAIGFIVVGAVVRQRSLLRDRDGVLDGLRRALEAVEQRARQLAGIENAGRELAFGGPTPAALDAIAGILADQFGYDHVEILLLGEAGLRHAAGRGSAGAGRPMDPDRGLLGKVLHGGRPELLTDSAAGAAGPGGTAAELGVRSEICVPLLSGDEILGVIDVQSRAEDRLDETDLAAVLAVADRIAGALALDRQRQQLVSEKDFVAAIFEAVGAVVIVLDSEGRLARYNAATVAVSGYSPSEIDEKGTLDFLVPDDQRPAVIDAIARLQTGKAMDQRENEWIRKDGTRRHLAWSNTAVRDAAGVVRYTIATGVDITERKDLEDELAHKALHDPLTGLPNRRLLMDRLEHALRQRRPSETCVLFLDVDELKAINDRYGHEVGDQVLREVADRLTQLVRPGDTVARLSGDEFAVVLEGVTGETAPDAVAARVLEATSRPIDLAEGSIGITVSIGAATSAAAGVMADDLLRDADFAMYAAKQRGSGQYRRYAPGDRDRADDDARLATDLVGAVDRGELRVHYQPIVDLRSGDIKGVEALARWQHPERGLLAPGAFIPIAERTGSIVDIGGWVLETACRVLRAWQIDRPGLTMAVNLSSRQLESPKLMSQVRQALKRTGVDPATLVLEVTETILLADPTAVAKLDALKALGVRLAIDDFGTGYSSISYLRRFPVDILKIDREFVDGADSPDGLRLLRGIAQLGQVVGLELIAEGIERSGQIDPIVEAGCQDGQGYLFARPVEEDVMVSLLRGGRLDPVPEVLPETPIRPAARRAGRHRPEATSKAG